MYDVTQDSGQRTVLGPEVTEALYVQVPGGLVILVDEHCVGVCVVEPS